MKLRNIITGNYIEAEVMTGQEWHDSKYSHPMAIYDYDHVLIGDHLNPENLSIQYQKFVIPPLHANNYCIITATAEEEQKLYDAGYRMIGLNNVRM